MPASVGSNFRVGSRWTSSPRVLTNGVSLSCTIYLSYRKMHLSDPGSPRSSRMRGVGEGASVKADAGWTEPVKRDKTATAQPYQHPNSVRLDDGRSLSGLERLQAGLCRSLGRVYPCPSALPDVLLTNGVSLLHTI